MADTPKTPKKKKSQYVGRQAQPVTLDKTARVDIDVNNKMIDAIIDAGETSMLDMNELASFTSISNSRDQMYQMIDSMMQDSQVSAVVRTYAEDVCEVNDQGHIMWAESSDPKVSKFINYLLDVMNVDKHIYGWAYSLIEYGDVYLKMFRESDYEDDFFDTEDIKGLYNARNVLNEKLNKSAIKKMEESVNVMYKRKRDPYSGYVEKVADPSTMFEVTRLGQSAGYIETPNVPSPVRGAESYAGADNAQNIVYQYHMKSSDVNLYPATEYVHGILDDNSTRFPETVELFKAEDGTTSSKSASCRSYTVRRGKSMLYDSYKTWREKQLLDAAVLLNRLTRSSLIRMIGVEVGDMSKEQSQRTLRRVKDLMEQKMSLQTNKSMGEYNNPGAFLNNVYYVKHGQVGDISINDAGGEVNVKDLADLDDWTTKFYGAYGIPKAYFGYTDDAAGFNGGSALSVLSSVYSKGVQRVQNALIQMVTDAVTLMLYDRGLTSYFNAFALKMKSPMNADEQAYRDNLSNRINACSNLASLFNDVESKPRKLRIVKQLLATLNYGDELQAILDEEIAEAERNIAEEKAKEDEENANPSPSEGGGGEELSLDDLEAPAPAEEAPAEEPAGDELTPMPMEGFKHNPGSTTLVEGPDVLISENDLPTGNELNKDFTENL